MNKNSSIIKSMDLIREGMKKEMYLPLNLQYFADDVSDDDEIIEDDKVSDDADDTNKDDKDSSDDNKDTKKTGSKDGKSFTQEDVNNIAAREAKRAQEKLLKSLGVKDAKSAKDGLEQFKKIQDDQKTDAEKAIDKAKTLEEENNNNLTKVQTLEAKLSALSNDVDPESVEDVVVLAKNLVNDDTDMDKAIKQVVKKYPHFKKSGKEDNKDDNSTTKKKPKFSTGDHKDDSKDSDKDSWVNAFNWSQKS